MATSCSLVLVNYHSAALAAEAIRTARAATQNPLQMIVVDNSVDPTEAAALRSHADVLLVPETNLGYGAAVNRARFFTGSRIQRARTNRKAHCLAWASTAETSC